MVKIQRCATFLLDNVEHVQEHITILVRTAHGKSRGLSGESEWSVSEQLLHGDVLWFNQNFSGIFLERIEQYGDRVNV